MTKISVALFAWLACFALTAAAAASKHPHLEAELVAAQTEVTEKSTLLVGIRLKMENGWHVYWRNPGDSGEAVTVQWKLPAGFQASPVMWPPPHRIPVPPLVNFGYEGETLLLSEIVTPEKSSGPVTLTAEVTWLVCQEVCIPGKATLKKTLPWAQGKQANASDLWEAFDAVRTTIPAASAQWKSSAAVEGKDFHLVLQGPTGGISRALFFPYSETLIQNAADQTPKIQDGRIEWKIPLGNFAEPEKLSPADFTGVVVFDGGESVEIAPGKLAQSGRLLEAILFALLGGLLLNLMPCVFPVLCLKVLSFARLGKAQRHHVLAHSLTYAAGILVSFWALAGALIALRAGGQALGWGFQLQSPVFLALLSFLLVGLSLNLFGVFEIGGSWMGLGQKLASQEGYAGAFFSGVLATLVATPCTAPFMGSAMGYALAQPAFASLLVFTALGVGLALPYVVFSAIPQLTDRLPRPGAWMETFKQLMAFPLLITAWWLLSVLALQTDSVSVFHLLLCLILFSLGLWAWGRARGRWAYVVLAVFFGLGSVAWAVRDLRNAKPAAVTAESGDWAPYSESALAAARASGTPVFIDFTAAWCITCQVNKRVAMEVESVQAKFREKKVKLFRADWTNQDEAIARKLESFGRNGVPLYVLFPAGAQSEARILPQLLTPEILISALDSL